MIVLKHLSRDYNIEPLRLRQLLRSEFGKPKKRRWRWDEDDKRDAKQLAKIRAFLKSLSKGTKP
jgi:hypothetical protein